jgi:peroxiredoxin
MIEKKPRSVARMLIFVSVVMMAMMAMIAGVSAQPKPKFHAPLQVEAHEYASLEPASFELENLELETTGGEKRRLGDLTGGKKMVLIHYFATFCHNSRYDIETINRIHREYEDQGVAVIGICEYSKPSQVQEFIEKHRLEYPILIEGRGRREDRERTSHYRYRKLAGDTRSWGTPLTIVIDGHDLLKDGGALARRMSVATGELIIEEFRRLVAAKKGPMPEGGRPEN